VRGSLALALCSWVAVLGCSGSGGGGAEDPGATPSPPGEQPASSAPELGNGDHTAASVVLTEIAGPGNLLKTPRDLAFNPRRPDELWIANLADESVVIVHDASTEARRSERRHDSNALHFFSKPAAIAFGADETSFGIPGTWASCGESRNTYHDMQAADDFMGPVLWSSDLSIFARKNPHGLGSHLDMLHNTPLCMGIAHETANVYWTFGGKDNAIFRYDFHVDHDIGQDDHSDGETLQYVRGLVKYAPGIPSHLVFDATDAMLYVADTGNARIARLDTKTGTRGIALPTKEPMESYFRMEGAELTDVVAGDPELLQSPSGLEMKGGLLYVSDHATGRISAFTKEGQRVNYLETGLGAGALAGMAFGPDGKLYFVDVLGSRVLRIDVP
jgi:hypothetical protein